MPKIPSLLLSSDSHIVEPPGLFVDRVAARFRDVAPKPVMVDGVEMWVLNGRPTVPVAAPYRPGDRFLPPEQRPNRTSYAEGVDHVGYDPTAWLRTHEQVGVWGSVLYPSFTLVCLALEDAELLEDVLRVYHEWIEEFTAIDPARLKPMALLNVDDPAQAARDLADFARRGFCGAAIPVVPMHDRYSDPKFDVLWEAAAGLDMPLHFHIVGHRTPHDLGFLMASPSELINAHDGFVRIALTDIVLSGVFERYPALQVVAVEFEAAWIPHWLQRMDWHYTQNLRFQMTNALHRFADGVLPSDMVHSNVHVSFTEDPFMVEHRQQIGVGHMMWGSDFPHAEGVYPHVERSLASQMRSVPDDEIYEMTVANTAALYGFELPAA